MAKKKICIPNGILELVISWEMTTKFVDDSSWTGGRMQPHI